jgi:hypothetical protein
MTVVRSSVRAGWSWNSTAGSATMAAASNWRWVERAWKA